MLATFHSLYSNLFESLVQHDQSIILIIDQMYQIGVKSFSITVLTGSCVGMVFALQSYIGFARFGGEQFIGLVVALGVIRELGPLMTGLMVTGRAGSAIAAEIATMYVTEQIDALAYIANQYFSVSNYSPYSCRDDNIPLFNAVCYDLWRCRWLSGLCLCSYAERRRLCKQYCNLRRTIRYYRWTYQSYGLWIHFDPHWNL